MLIKSRDGVKLTFDVVVDQRVIHVITDGLDGAHVNRPVCEDVSFIRWV